MQSTGADFVYDLCIVGAGMFGSAAAKHASADPSIKVCLIGPDEPTVEERPQRDVFAAHYDEGRITRILDEKLECQVLAKNSIGRYRDIEENSGVQFYNPVGCLFMRRKGTKCLNKLTDTARLGNISLINFTDEDSLQEKYPFLKMKDDECGLLDDNGAGYISPRNLVMAQKKIAKSQGCDIIESVVVQIASHAVHEVETVSMGTIKAKRILIATGAFTGLKSFEVLKPIALKRCKRTVVLLKIPKEEAERIRLMPSIIRQLENENSLPSVIGAYILPPIQYPDGNYYLKFGESGNADASVINSLEEMKDWYQSDGEQSLISTHVDFVTELLPELKFTSVSTMSCATCYSPSGLPYIDKVSPTVTVALAGNGIGAKLSDEVGRLAAKLSITGQWDSVIPHEQFKVLYQ